MNFFLGCAVWAYSGWIGNFYPTGSRSSELLRLYSHHFPTVEGNTTFYVTPDAKTLARWVAETPEGFRFCLKLPRSITHQGLLEPAIAPALEFLEQMQPLGNRLGPIFAQLPPTYSPAWIADLTTFLTAWPHAIAPLALEVRHPEWFQAPHANRLNELLQQLGIGRVLLDSRPVYQTPGDPQCQMGRRKPQLPLHLDVTAPFTFVRFISHPDPALNQVYLQEWVPWIAEWLRQGIQVYFFVHCPIEARSPANAQCLQDQLGQAELSVPTLPWQVSTTPVQLSLF